MPAPASGRAVAGNAAPPPSAEDFDATGILRGIDPCESRYWWIPDLYGPEATTLPGRGPGGRLATGS